MSKSLIYSIVLVLSVICAVHGNTSAKITAPQKNPDHPNKCWDEMSQTAYAVGTHNRKDLCQRIHCYPDFRIKYTSCGTHSMAQGYTIEQDLSKGYPECCAKLVKMERTLKRVDYDASTVKINKFKPRERSIEKVAEKKMEKNEKLEKKTSTKAIESTTAAMEIIREDTTKKVSE